MRIEFFKKFSWINYAFSLLIVSTTSVYAQHNISIDVNTELNNVENKPVGINVNHLMDGSYIQPTISTANALKTMGTKFLRFPGGETSDNYLWSVSPWSSISPQFSRPGSCEWPSNDSRFANTDFKTPKSLMLDFEEFMTMSKTVGGEPIIVVAYDAMYKPASCGTIPTREQLLKNAEEWVRYANITKGYKIKYWMIGNESHKNCTYNGCATASIYRDDIILFSKRMKAVDPSIKIIANGDGQSWWQTILPTASAHIDYIGLNNYPVYKFSGGYDYYKNNVPDFTSIVKNTVNYINLYAPLIDRSRLKIITTEFNSKDFSGYWVSQNNLGHALACFEIMGEHLKNKKVEASLFWNTRWINNVSNTTDIYDALKKDGNLQPNGMALSIWGNNLLKNLVATTSTSKVRSFASYDAVTKKLNLFIINKETTAQTANIALTNYLADASGEKWEFKGTGSSDTNPTWKLISTEKTTNKALSLNLPAVSITLVKLSPTIISNTTPTDTTTNTSGNTGSTSYTGVSTKESGGTVNLVAVNSGSIINDVSKKPMGINIDYLMDGGYTNPAISTSSSLKNMGAKFLRYPGGEKADNYLWSISPWDKSNPQFARPGSCEWPSSDTRFANTDYKTLKPIVLDFDEFVNISKTISGEPIIVVPYDAIYKAASCGTIPTLEQVIKNAEEWVRYANITKGYNIKYWMIGNESYNCSYNGCATATQYRDDVIAFSKRMKAIDPSIKIIANGDGLSWWQTVLPTASPFIDFIGISNYPAYKFTGGYDYYKNNTPDFTSGVKDVIGYLNSYAPSADKSRIKVITTEFNANDWSGLWVNMNDLGHALAAFEILGEHLKMSSVEAAIFWNTRWVNNVSNTSDIYDALKSDGNFQPNGTALSIWGNNILKKMVSASGTTKVRSFASYDDVSKQLNLFLINKETSLQTANISFSNYLTTAGGERWQLKGIGSADTKPTYTKVDTVWLNGSSMALNLPPVSITMVKLQAITLQAKTAIISQINETEEIKSEIMFDIMPNPASNFVRIKMNESTNSPLTLKVMSMDGREIYSGAISENQNMMDINISEWAAGIYIVHISDANKKSTKKLIVK